MKVTIKVEGMMCPHCEAHVKKSLEAVNGVVLAEASHKAGEVVVTLSGDVSLDTLKDVITKEGYTVK